MSPSLENESHVFPLSRWPLDIHMVVKDELCSSLADRTAMAWCPVSSFLSSERTEHANVSTRH